MKYMHYKNSCAYAGLATLLELADHETEDYSIAKEIGLPYLFSYEGGCYSSGFRLQSERYFNLYTLPLGLSFTERHIPKEKVPAMLRKMGASMLGLDRPKGTRHTFVFSRYEEGKYKFWNMQEEPEKAAPLTAYALTAEELLAHTPEMCTIGYLSPSTPTYPCSLLSESMQVLENMKEDLLDFCSKSQSPESLAEQRDRLFRPLFLDSIAMMEILDRKDLAKEMQVLQGELLGLLKSGKDYVPFDGISKERLLKLVAALQRLQKQKQEKSKRKRL